jgi:selenocysteine lyase/cysteine desulfurase
MPADRRGLVLACRPVRIRYPSFSLCGQRAAILGRHAGSTALHRRRKQPAVLPYTVAANSLETINQIGIERIRAHSLELTQAIIDNVPRKYLFSTSRPATGMRLSPHIYTSRDEIETVNSCLSAFSA